MGYEIGGGGGGESNPTDHVNERYDSDASGVVDDAEQLGGQNPSYYLEYLSLTGGTNVSVEQADGTATIDVTDSDTHVAIQQDDGTTLLANPDALREGTNIALTESGGVVTIESTATGVTTADKQAMTTHPIPVTEIADGDYVDFPMRVPEGKTAKVWKWGARTDAQTTPNGLTVGLWDFDSASYISSESVAYATGSPRASHEGAGDLALRVENQTGGTLNVGADFSATIE